MLRNVRLRGWLIEALTSRVLWPLVGLLASIFAVDAWNTTSASINETQTLGHIFLAQQRANFQLFDYTRVSDQLASFFEKSQVKFVEVETNSHVIVAAFMPAGGANFQQMLGDGDQHLHFAWYSGRPYVTLMSQLNLPQDGQAIRLRSVVPLLTLLGFPMLRGLLLGLTFAMVFLSVKRSIDISASVVSKTIEEFAGQAVAIRSSQDKVKAPVFPGERRITEFEELAASFERLLDNLRKREVDVAGSSRHKALGELAASVAHDIRSPLSALNIVTASLRDLPEAKKSLLYSAIARINQIADDLLNVHRQEKSVENSPGTLSEMIGEIVTEKRLQISALRRDITVRTSLEILGNYKLGCPPADFQRVLSNLITNSIEAINGDGVVSIRGEMDDVFVRIFIEDSGPGIPPQVLDKLGVQGISFGKAGGNGLGLLNAFRSVRSWGGNVLIESRMGEGTGVCLVLPKA